MLMRRRRKRALAVRGYSRKEEGGAEEMERLDEEEDAKLRLPEEEEGLEEVVGPNWDEEEEVKEWSKGTKEG